MDKALLTDDQGNSLHGRCGYCRRRVDNHDEQHRVSEIMRGGYGVECAVRGDIHGHEAMPLGRRQTAQILPDGVLTIDLSHLGRDVVPGDLLRIQHQDGRSVIVAVVAVKEEA